MPRGLIVLVSLVLLVLGSAGCATVASPDAKAEAVSLKPTPFEAWATRNATGGFFGPVGPGGGAGVQLAWPQ
jgi:hypothetical protein